MSKRNSKSYSVAVLGASGTTGTELCKLLQGHPSCSISLATSERFAGSSLRDIDPSAPDIPLQSCSQIPFDEIDVVFLCVPHGTSVPIVEQCVEAGVLTIDLSGDLRLENKEIHGLAYGTERPDALMNLVRFGITELSRKEIRSARLLSNPGCYPTCSSLALYPLAVMGALPKTIVIDAKSGISGAGRKATDITHYCSVVDDVRPYSVGRSHRHTYEIEQIIHSMLPAESARPQVIFCPHVVAMERGMLATIVLEIPRLSYEEIYTQYQEVYSNELFVRVLPQGECARVKAVQRSNFAVIGITPVAGTQSIVLTCAIDNLLKGASGQALQSMNVMLGLPEETGLMPQSLIADELVSNKLQANN